MKKNYLLIILALFLLNVMPAFSQTDTILVDFGAQASLSSGVWNSHTNSQASAVVTPLKNTLNLTTAVGLSVYDSFTGINETGTATPDASIDFPGSATRDSYFGSAVAFGGVTEPTGGIELTGLNPAKLYTFIIFGSRTGVSDIRETKYRFDALTPDSAYLNTSNNTMNVTTKTVQPKADGSLKMLVGPGEGNTNSSKFYYFGAMKIVYESEPALPAAITVNSPNGGEVLLAGSTQTITWSKTNLTDGIALSYSIDNGANWISIGTADVSATSLDWLVPGSGSAECLISATSGTATDVSDAAFTIAIPSLGITAPNGGEDWEVGTSQNITWTAEHISADILLEYSSDNGVNWNSITTVPSSQTSFEWLVPNTASTECYIRATSGLTEDKSDAVFTISEPAVPTITLIAPNGGETLYVGSVYAITWITANIALEYSLDNGGTWLEIASVASTRTSFDWIIPNSPSALCLVSVSSGGTSDVSSSIFSIEVPNDTISIDFGAQATKSAEPWNNLAEVMGAGEIAQLKNSRNLLTGIGLTIYDRFNGINETGATTPDVSLGLPVSATRDNYYGCVVEFSGGTEPTGGMHITGLTPDKNYKFVVFGSRAGAADNRETKYKFVSNTIDSVYINTSNNVITSASVTIKPKADGTVTLIVSPGENNTNAPYKFYYLGALTIIYELEEALPSTATLISPSGGEKWVAGSTQTISWAMTNITGAIDISYSSDNGVNWTLIQSVENTTQSLEWLVPEDFSSTCLVKVVSGSASDVSDNTFSILNPNEPSISLISPNGGENWIVGTTHSIAWEPLNLTENISIEYSTDNGGSWNDLASVAPTAVSYEWTVPDAVSTQCLVRLSSGIYFDESYQNFSIVEKTCNSTIVILGSSTAYGSGASTIDSSWVKRYTAALKAINSNYTVVNLALGGYTTFQMLPTGTVMPDGITETIDVNRNVTKALTYNPYAIIVNMPSNDANKNYSVEKQLNNYAAVVNAANAQGVTVWIATTQPRNFTDPAQIKLQSDMADTLLYIYGENAIDFWSITATPNGLILPQYNSGDGVHLNNAGHRVLFEKVMAKQIETLACLPDGIRNLIPVVAGVRVYPNPYSDLTTIEFETASGGIAEVRFLDLTGRQVGTLEARISNAGTHSLQVSNEEIKSSGPVIVAVIKISDSQGIKLSNVKLIRMNLN